MESIDELINTPWVLGYILVCGGFCKYSGFKNLQRDPGTKLETGSRDKTWYRIPGQNLRPDPGTKLETGSRDKTWDRIPGQNLRPDPGTELETGSSYFPDPNQYMYMKSLTRTVQFGLHSRPRAFYATNIAWQDLCATLNMYTYIIRINSGH